eukprot:1327002-Prymnesium_polylepis.1
MSSVGVRTDMKRNCRRVLRTARSGEARPTCSCADLCDVCPTPAVSGSLRRRTCPTINVQRWMWSKLDHELSRFIMGCKALQAGPPYDTALTA